MANILYRGTTPSAGNTTTGGVSRPLTNDEIDKNFWALNNAKLESEADTLDTVATRGASTSKNLSMTGTNNIGATGVTTTINGTLKSTTIKGANDAQMTIYGGDITSDSYYDMIVRAGNRTGTSSFADSAGSLYLKGGDVTGGNGFNLGGDVYLYGGDITGITLPGSKDGRGGSIHIVSGTNGWAYTGVEAESGSIYIDIAALPSTGGTRTLGKIKIGTGTATKTGGVSSVLATPEVIIGSSGSSTTVAGSFTVNGMAYLNNAQVRIAEIYCLDGINSFGYWDITDGLVTGDSMSGGGKLSVLGTSGAKIGLTPGSGNSTNSVINSGLGIDFKLNNQTSVHARMTITDFTHVGDIIAYGSLSDIKLKENIVRIDNPLNKVKQLNGYSFNYKGYSKKMLGVIAQELEAVAPELVFEHENLDTGEVTKAVRYSQITAILIEAIKELSDKVEDLQNQLANK